MKDSSIVRDKERQRKLQAKPQKNLGVNGPSLDLIHGMALLLSL